MAKFEKYNPIYSWLQVSSNYVDDGLRTGMVYEVLSPVPFLPLGFFITYNDVGHHPTWTSEYLVDITGSRNTLLFRPYPMVGLENPFAFGEPLPFPLVLKGYQYAGVVQMFLDSGGRFSDFMCLDKIFWCSSGQHEILLQDSYSLVELFDGGQERLYLQVVQFHKL